jgi:two-component system response regulator RegX3
MNVLLIEDDDAIAEALVKGLSRDGFTVQRTRDGHSGLAAPRPDVVLLDLGLPDMDGYEVCRRMRATSDVPIIILSARGEEVNRVVGLELGADDYLVKPFGLRELVARIRAVQRRTTAGQAATQVKGSIEAGRLAIDLRTRRVTIDGEEVALTPKEFDLLLLLAQDPGAVCSRQDILESVWDAHWYGPSKTLDVHVASIRKKLNDPGIIETVRGIGFRLRPAE